MLEETGTAVASTIDIDPLVSKQVHTKTSVTSFLSHAGIDHLGDISSVFEPGIGPGISDTSSHSRESSGGESESGSDYDGSLSDSGLSEDEDNGSSGREDNGDSEVGSRCVGDCIDVESRSSESEGNGEK